MIKKHNHGGKKTKIYKLIHSVKENTTKKPTHSDQCHAVQKRWVSGKGPPSVQESKQHCDAIQGLDPNKTMKNAQPQKQTTVTQSMVWHNGLHWFTEVLVLQSWFHVAFVLVFTLNGEKKIQRFGGLVFQKILKQNYREENFTHTMIKWYIYSTK